MRVEHVVAHSDQVIDRVMAAALVRGQSCFGRIFDQGLKIRLIGLDIDCGRQFTGLELLLDRLTCCDRNDVRRRPVGLNVLVTGQDPGYFA